MLVKKGKVSQKGVTLIEVIVAMFVFVTIIIATTAVFSSSSQSKKFITSSQKKYDAAFATLGEVGKYLSTSTTNLTMFQSSGGDSLVVYNYSQHTCAQFSFMSNKLVVKKQVMQSSEYYKSCSSNYLSRVTSETVIDNATGLFYFKKIEFGSVGNSAFVTIAAKVYDGDPNMSQSKWIPLQTTLSLRDYLVEETAP